MRKMISKFAVLFAFTCTADLNAQSPAASGPLEKIQTKVYDLLDRDMTSVNFAKGGMALTVAEKRNLRAVYSSVKDDTAVKRIIIASWADRDGASKREKLTDAQLNLADKRAAAIELELTALGARNLEKHNMAKDASWLAQTFQTQDAALKGAAKGEMAAHSEIEELAKTLEAKGGPGKALVIIQREIPEASRSR